MAHSVPYSKAEFVSQEVGRFFSLSVNVIQMASCVKQRRLCGNCVLNLSKIFCDSMIVGTLLFDTTKNL